MGKALQHEKKEAPASYTQEQGLCASGRVRKALYPPLAFPQISSPGQPWGGRGAVGVLGGCSSALETRSSLCLAPGGRGQTSATSTTGSRGGDKREEEEAMGPTVEKLGPGRAKEGGELGQGYFCTIIQGQRAKLTGQ